MVLSIITINRDNAQGLERTIKSVLSQTVSHFEFIIVDGASIDYSVSLIQQFENEYPERIKWVSEPDKGIYNAMNKGISMASGHYVQFLNSGDCLASNDIVSRVYDALDRDGYPPILYGNILKEISVDRRIRDVGFAGKSISMLSIYVGTLNHSSAFIRKDLFRKYGYYDETLKIVSDWKWFLEVIVLGEEKPTYVDIDVTVYDMHGVSETSKTVVKAERAQVLKELIPHTILADYDRWAGTISMMKRVERHPWAFKLVRLLERFLFQVEKFGRKHV